MDNSTGVLSDLNITPELRAFLRAELAQVVTFDALDGGHWNPHSIAGQIASSPDIPGHVSDDTISRFLSGAETTKTGKSALTAIAGFLLAFEFISADDLRHYSAPGYARAASALAQLFAPAEDTALIRRIVGEYRDYRMMGHRRLIESVVILASPDNGRTLTAHERRKVFILQEPQHLLDVTANLDPARYHRIPGLLEEPEGVVEAQVNGPGVGLATAQVVFLTMGGAESALHGLIAVHELHFDGGGIAGMRARRSPDWVRIENGIPTETDTPQDELHALRRWLATLELYPQGKRLKRLPEFAPEGAESLDGVTRGDGFGFQRPIAGRMDEKDQRRLEAEEIELEIEAALLACADATQRLALSIDLMRVDHALKAVEEGADLNAVHSKRDIPMLHAVASLGMRKLVRAMMARDVDLTVRDKHGRLASTCADNCAGDFELRDELARAQTAEFRAKGIDPRRPGVPGHGGYILTKDIE